MLHVLKTRRKTVLFAAIAMICIGCQTADPNKTVKKTKDSANSPVVNNLMDSSTNKNVCTEEHALDLIMQIPEVKKQQHYIDSLTDHKHGLAMINYDQGKENHKPYYEINVGYSSDTRFENFFIFRVDKTDCSISVNDPVLDAVLPLKEWQARKAEEK